MGEQDSGQATAAREDATEPEDRDSGDAENTPTEKPEPDEEDKEKAAEMMTAYEEKPTLILPGTGGAVSGTAVGAWLDDDGNPKFADDDGPAAKAKAEGDKGDDGETAEHDFQEQVDKDKEFNAAVIKAAEEDGRGGDKEDEKAVST